MFKFNGEKGAIVCDGCNAIIAENVTPVERNMLRTLCPKCMEPNRFNLTTVCDDCLGTGNLIGPCQICGGSGFKRGHD